MSKLSHINYSCTFLCFLSYILSYFKLFNTSSNNYLHKLFLNSHGHGCRTFTCKGIWQCCGNTLICSWDPAGPAGLLFSLSLLLSPALCLTLSLPPSLSFLAIFCPVPFLHLSATRLQPAWWGSGRRSWGWKSNTREIKKAKVSCNLKRHRQPTWGGEDVCVKLLVGEKAKPHLMRLMGNLSPVQRSRESQEFDQSSLQMSCGYLLCLSNFYLAVCPQKKKL